MTTRLILVLGIAAPVMAAAEPEEHSLLPFLAEAARARGHKLPLPFGAALVITGLDNRAIEVTDVRVSVAGAPLRSAGDFVELGSTSKVFNANLKLDAWLLPFLNLYGLVGYIHNQSSTRARVTLPLGPAVPPLTRETTVDTDLEGTVGGIGATLAGGYGSLYFVADCNYSQSDLGFDDEFTALIASVRAGWNGRINGVPVQLWLGVGNWDTAATASGHADLADGVRLDFEADQRPVTNWLYDAGANVELSRQFHLFVDIGLDLNGGYLLALGPTYRF